MGFLSRILNRKGNGPSKKKYSNKFINFDLLYQLSYMSVIASSGLPRNQIFERSAQLDCASSYYFRKIQLAHDRLGYEYPKACRVIGETADNEEMKELLLRFSSSLYSGEPEADFLSREANSKIYYYDNEYERKLSTLRQWTDAYVSLSLSAIVVLIIGLVSTMLWDMGDGFLMGLCAISIGTAFLGVWMILVMTPKEIMTLPWAGSKEQKIIRAISLLLIPFAIINCCSLWLQGVDLGWILITGAVTLFPIGYMSYVDDKNIIKRDVEIGSFLGTLSGACAAMGTTVKDALGKLDLKAINALRPEVKRLHTRLSSGLNSGRCWKKFVEETGSELSNRSVSMFYDAVSMGGEPANAGYHTSLFASRIALLRAKRKTISAPFRWLCIAMHAAVVALLIFITETVTIFGTKMATATEDMTTSSEFAVPNLGGFNTGGAEIAHSLALPVILVFTIANAIAPTIAEGGNYNKIFYNFGIAAAISGALLLVLPIAVEKVFEMV